MMKKKKIIENAETQYEILDKNNNSTFIQLKPITGRKHQLRKQLFDLGHSIIGDKKYDLDPSISVSLPESHPDHGKTVQEVVGIATITDAMIADHKEKDTWEQMREYRNLLLADCDWTQGADVPDAIKSKWQSYRQALRNLPSVSTPTLNADGSLNQSSVTWPTQPS